MIKAGAIVLSLALHGALLGVMVRGPTRPREPRAPQRVEVRVVREPRAPKASPAPEPSTPPPSVAPAPKRAARSAPPPAAPPPAAVAPVAAGPALATDVVLSGTVGGAPSTLGRPTPASDTPAPRTRPAAPPPAAACAEPLSKPRPATKPRDIEYPEAVRARGVEGRLVLRVDVRADGSVAQVVVLEPVDPELDAAAVEAVRTWTFSPATACGEPTSAPYTLARRFELGG